MEYIEFPSLGIHLEVNPILAEFELFGIPFAIHWYGVMIALGFLLAILYAVRNAPRFGVPLEPMTDVVLVSTPFSVLFARIYYILFYDGVETFWKEPLKVFRVWEGGLAIYGAVIGAFLAGFVMCRIRKIKPLAMIDLACVGFLIGQCLGRWGNFFNQEAFGGNTDLPWGMTGSIIAAGTNGSGYLTGQPVHPTFLYESLWCLIGFILLHIWSKKRYRFHGQIFCGYLSWYGLGRFFIEGLRTDSLMLGTMRVSQLLAALCVIGGIVLYAVLKGRADTSPADLFAAAADTAEAEASAETSAETAEETENAAQEPKTEETEDAQDGENH